MLWQRVGIGEPYALGRRALPHSPTLVLGEALDERCFDPHQRGRLGAAHTMAPARLPATLPLRPLRLMNMKDLGVVGSTKNQSQHLGHSDRTMLAPLALENNINILFVGRNVAAKPASNIITNTP